MSNLTNCPFKRIRIFFIVACLVLSCLHSNAQIVEERAYWTELQRYNYLSIDSLWLFHPGFEKPTTMDGGWEKANTIFLTNEKGQPLQGGGLGWYQKTFGVPPAFRGKAVALRIGHLGASEIFYDGKLIRRYGEVAGSIEDEKIFVPRAPVYIFLDSQFSHTILVHYSNMHVGVPYYVCEHPGFRLFIAPADVFPQSEPSTVPTLPISASIMFLFGIFFLFVYFFYPKRLASLLTMILLLNFSALFASIYISTIASDWETLRRASAFSQIASFCNSLLPLLVLYALYYNIKMPRRTYFVIIAMFIGVFAVLYPQFGDILVPILILTLFEQYRMIILGIRDKRPGFWILLIGSIIQQAGYIIIVRDTFHWFPEMTPRVILITMIFPQLGVPLTYALQFAWEFGTANRDLRLQLAQVNTLSERTLRQEKEKQEMLTQQKEKLEVMVTDRTRELSQQKEALQDTLINLEATQAQLIQSEKMASLGELTAGIAHEIQNPLNFINNFSEVNRELIEEMESEIDQGNIEGLKAIAVDVRSNEEKISHHGKRADAIVKGMLQHSRISAGQKEAVDINALADEYLRLSYHGLRSKDKSFNANLQTDFDPSVGNINIVPQEIGRVLLNLYNNAFYAVNEKKKQQIENYEPAISVTTRRNGNKLSISVKDNGGGIPKKIVDKIFQPFFTSKPTGEGTGLGLSLSYDIIKAHGGEIKVDTKEGEFTEFLVVIPYT